MTDAPFLSEVLRERILERLLADRPSIITFVAPAGFGKSTAVRQYAETTQSFAICDLFGVDDVASFGDRLADALASDDSALQDSLSQQRMTLGKEPQAWSDFALKSWDRSVVDLMIFENSESLLGNMEALDLLGRLLSRSKQGSTVALCSRSAIPLRLTRFAPPHKVVTFGAINLRFDREEIAAVFESDGISALDLERVAEISQGWPIAVFLLSRFSREGRLHAMLDKLDDSAFESLHEYLIDQVLLSLDDASLDIALAIVSVPATTYEDISNLLRHHKLGKEWPHSALDAFITKGPEDTYKIHPLISATLKIRFGERGTHIVRTMAKEWALRGNAERAAELYLAIGDHEEAASIVESVGTLYLDTPSPVYARVVQTLDVDALLRRPGLWAAATPCRFPALSQEQWISEAAIVYHGLTPNTASLTRSAVTVSYANALINAGKHEEALSLLDELSADPSEEAHLLNGMLRSATYARMNQFHKSIKIWDSVEAAFRKRRSSYALCLNECVAHAARVRGDSETERRILAGAIEIAQASGFGMAICYMYMDAIFGAWFAGNRSLYEAYIDQFANSVPAFMAKSTRMFLSAVRGDLGDVCDWPGNPRYHCYALLIAAANDRIGIEQRIIFVKRAAAIGDAYGEPFLSLLCALAHALMQPERRSEMLAIAVRNAELIDIREPMRALASFQHEEKKLTMFSAFVHSYEHPELGSKTAIELSLLNGYARVEGRPIKLTKREFELLAALGLKGPYSSREYLVTLLWPENESAATATALRVLISRLRSKLTVSAIESTRDGYRISAKMLVDITIIEDRLHRALGRGAGQQKDDFGQLVSDFHQMSDGVPNWVGAFGWFAAFEIRLSELAHRVGAFIAEEYLRAGRFEEALQITGRLIDYDQFDERARAIALRAQFLGGNHVAARRAFEQYRQFLRQELDCEPSEWLSDLVNSAQPH